MQRATNTILDSSSYDSDSSSGEEDDDTCSSSNEECEMGSDPSLLKYWQGLMDNMKTTNMPTVITARPSEIWHALGCPASACAYTVAESPKPPGAGDLVKYNDRLYFFQPNGKNSCYLYIHQFDVGNPRLACWTPSRSSVSVVEIRAKTQQL